MIARYSRFLINMPKIGYMISDNKHKHNHEFENTHNHQQGHPKHDHHKHHEHDTHDHDHDHNHNHDHSHDHSHADFQPQQKTQQQSEQIIKQKRDFIDTTVKSNKVVLFMKGTPVAPSCGYSNYAVEILKFYKIKDYISVDVLKDNILREEVKKYSNWPTFPQLYVKGELIGGCDIMMDMHKDGSLTELFKKI